MIGDANVALSGGIVGFVFERTGEEVQKLTGGARGVPSPPPFSRAEQTDGDA
jgi:hypothetical protein